MKAWEWSAVERNIVAAIAVRIRLLSAPQVVRGWLSQESSAAELADRVLERLESASLLARHVVEAHPMLELTRPLYAWNVGDRPPSDRRFQSIAAASRARWNLPHRPVEVFTVTKRTVSLFGAFVDARRIKQCEATHDLHFTEVYLRYRHQSPKLAANWLGEAAFPKLGLEVPHMKDPDAFVISRQGKAQRIIEFGGAYDAEHLQAFHEHCAGGAAAHLAARGWTDSDNPFARLYSPAGTSYELW